MVSIVYCLAIIALELVLAEDVACTTAKCCHKHPRSRGCRDKWVPGKGSPSGRSGGGGGAKRAGGSTAALYASCEALDVGPQPISELELQQGAKLVRDGPRWIKRFDREAVEATYYRRFQSEAQDGLVPGLRLAGEPVLCLGARLGGEVRALTRLGALAIGIDFNPGFRNPHVLWGDALHLQFADSTFRAAYTNVLDHISGAGIGVFVRHVARVLKPGGLWIIDMDAHKPDKYAQKSSDFAAVVASVERSLAAGGMTVASRRPFCRSSAELAATAAAPRNASSCVLGNPTGDGGVDPAGGVSLVASRLG